jgi:hypothetical protein
MEQTWKEYCGSKNWDDIPNHLKQMENQFANPIWVAADGSGFDMTQHEIILDTVAEQVKRFLKKADVQFPNHMDREAIYEVIKKSSKLYVSIFNGALRFKTRGRASGDGWTTGFNTAQMISFWKVVEYICKLIDKTFRCEIIVKGDDVLICLDKKHRELFERIAWTCMAKNKNPQTHGLGQICKFLKFGELHELDFLSSYFVPTSAGYRMIRKAGRLFEMTPWATLLSAQNPAISAQLCYANGLCVLAWAKGLPLFESYGRMLVRVSQLKRNLTQDLLNVVGACNSLGVNMDYNQKIGTQTPCTADEFNNFMCEKYSCTSTDLERLQKKFDQCFEQYAIIKDPLMDSFVMEDC